MFLKPNPSIKLDIIYEDKDIIVIDKPAGILTHPLRPEQNDTLVNGLLAYYPAIKDIGDDSPTGELRPGIVHRLDKDTSGLIIAAKNNLVFEYLKNQFAERKIEKHYLALVIGKVKDKKGIITKAISRSKKSGFKRSALLDEKSKSAWTQYKVLKYFKDYTLLDVFPKTGRTHQIRVHLASIGHPIAGDEQYKFKRQPLPENLKRQFLHAHALKFQLLSGKMTEFKSSLPKDLKNILDKLEQ